MRKTVCLFLVFALAAALPFGCLAASSNETVPAQEDDVIIHYVSPDDIAFIPETGTPINPKDPTAARETYSFDFAGYAKNVLVPCNESFTIDDNVTTTLTIRACVWRPTTNTVQIGFYNLNTGMCYGRNYTNGSISNATANYSLPGGTYWVYAMNLTDGVLTSGAISYTIT